MKRSALLSGTYLLTFLLSLHAYLFLYINSSILGEFVSEKNVGLIFSLGALLSIPVLLYLPRALKKVGDIRFTILALILEAGALFLLTYGASPAVVVIAFLAHYILVRVLYLNIDVLLETISSNSITGRLRGILMTVGNTALVLSPLIVGFVLKESEMYTRVFFASMCALVPAIILLSVSFKHFKDPKYAHVSLVPTLKAVWRHPALRLIFSANFLLRTFYAVMVVYMGLYLHNSLGMSWQDIGIVFTVMLIPFAVFEYPLGRLADTRWGEKEIMFAGFVLTAVATALLSWIRNDSVLVWSIMLFLTRVGASAVEIMTETYFFKHVGKEDVEMVSLYRIVEPAGYLIAPFIFSLLLLFADTRFIFLALGVVTLLGVWPTLRLHDTK